MNYFEYIFTVKPAIPAVDILISELAEIGFESFEENNEILKAYIQEELDITEICSFLKNENLNDFEITFEKVFVPAQNWNATWESQFEPIVINDDCIIIAPFHEVPESFKFPILISPKMSFGTGHHATTFLMSKQLFEEDISGKLVLDMGCGTSVLAIIAEKLNAKKITAIDIDQWGFENSIENVSLNNCSKIEVFKGDSSLLGKEEFDIVLANINKNVLLTDVKKYFESIKHKGLILLSGFFEVDTEEIRKKYTEEGFTFLEQKLKNEWALLKFQKQ